MTLFGGCLHLWAAAKVLSEMLFELLLMLVILMITMMTGRRMFDVGQYSAPWVVMINSSALVVAVTEWPSLHVTYRTLCSAISWLAAYLWRTKYLLPTCPALIALSFQNGMGYCLANMRTYSFTNCCTSREKMVKIGWVVFELKWGR